MKKTLLCLILGIFLVFPIHAQFVKKDMASRVAGNFLTDISTEKSTVAINNIENIKHQDTTVYYIIRTINKGSAIISADMKVKPVLAYSEKNNFSGQITHPALQNLLDFYKRSIYTILTESNNKEENTAHKQWNDLLQKRAQKQSTKSVSPLLNVNWDQGAGWNKYCPEDQDGPGGHAYAGCVAVSMAQAMSVFNHPERGTSSKSYVSSYGTLSADFENTEYRWISMSKNQPDNFNAKLLYHCGIAIEMGYESDGSGAYTEDVPTALKKYFDYSENVDFTGNTGGEEFISLLQNELDEGRPVIYSGDDGVESGHAFNLDGYSNDQFHVNWGWNGQYNGYYSLSGLRPGTYDFTHGQGAVIGIEPFDHAPQDIKLTNNLVLQNQPSGTSVGAVKVVDNDENDYHHLEVLSSNGGTSRDFTIEKDTLKTNTVLTYSETKPYHEIYIDVRDSQGNTLRKSFKIYVKETNHNPTELNLSDTLIETGTKYYQKLGSFSTADKDDMDNHTYTFVDDGTTQSKDNDMFFIEDSVLIAGASFNKINRKYLHILVKTDDGFGGKLVKSFILNNEFIATGIKDKTTSDIKLYPNPFQHSIEITGLPADKRTVLYLYNLQGKLIKRKILNEETTRINLESITPGPYIIKIESEYQTLYQQLLIKK